MQKVQGCEVCGVVMHEGCARRVPQDCRPVAEAGDRMLHLWKPAGVVLHDSTGEVTSAARLIYPCLVVRGLEGTHVLDLQHVMLFCKASGD